LIFAVIPAKAGIHCAFAEKMDPGFLKLAEEG